MRPRAIILILDFQDQILKKPYPRNGVPIDKERKGYESIWSWIHFITLYLDLIHDLDFGF